MSDDAENETRFPETGLTPVQEVLKGQVTVYFKDGVPQTHPRINVTFVDGGIKIRYDNGSWVWIPHHQINAVRSGGAVY
jgi:hypothetical protein